MKLFEIYGASDDLIETDGLPGCNEFNVYPKTNYVEQMQIKAKSGTLSIHVIYAGHWCFAIGAEDGDYSVMPPWKITREWGTQSDYSETVKIECPDDAVLIRDKKKNLDE